MEKFNTVLIELMNSDNIRLFIENRKAICQEENETNYKGSEWARGKNIGINRNYNIVVGGQTSACSDFLLDDRLIVVNASFEKSFLKIGNIDFVYQALFESLSNNSDMGIDVKTVANLVSLMSDNFFGTNWNPDKRGNVLNSADVVTLEEFRGKNIAECVERATFCHNLFKILGIDSTLKFSSIERNGESTIHTYNIIRINGQNFIFDTSIPKRDENGNKIPIVGTLSDDEYMLMVYGRSSVGCKTDVMSNGVVYDSSFKPAQEMLENMSPELREDIKKRALLDNPQDSSGIELMFSNDVDPVESVPKTTK